MDIFAPMPPMPTLEERVRRQVDRMYASNPSLRVPKPGHPDFVGPLPARPDHYFDPRPNVPGRTYWGD